MHYRTRDSPEENNAESISEQEQETNLKQLASEKKPLPENISKFIQKAQDELKEYEERSDIYIATNIAYIDNRVEDNQEN